jgi:hypothetical protein
MPTDLEDDFDEEDIEPDLEEPDLDEEDLVEEDLVAEVIEEELEGEIALVEDLEPPEEAAPKVRPKVAGEEEEEDEELDPDDVEADLDTILKDRIAAADDLEEEEEEEEDELTGEPATRVHPKTESEFVCKSCFLVKNVTQRVPGTDDLCNDCV